MELRSLRIAKVELEEPEESLADVLEEPAPVAAERPVEAAALEPAAPEVVLLEEPLELEVLVVPPPETTSPTWPESDTMVPLSGAYSLVSCTACSSLWTVSLSLFTAALADARLASRVAALTVVVGAAELDFDAEESDSSSLVARRGVVVVLRLGAVPAAGVVALGVVVRGVVVPGVAPLGEPVPRVAVGVLLAGTVGLWAPGLVVVVVVPGAVVVVGVPVGGVPASVVGEALAT
jgi:hypothetical protein